MQHHARRFQLLLIGVILSGCVESPDGRGDSFEAAQEFAELEYVDKNTAAKALERNEGIAMTPTGEEIALDVDDLCDSPQAHVRIPEGFTVVPNEAGDGFRVVPEADEDLTSFRKPVSVSCSGCVAGCAPYANGDMVGCTAGCSPCKADF